MWTLELSQRTNASATTIWALWTDVSSWPEWDISVDLVKLNGAFAPGAKGTLTLRNGKTFDFQITTIEELSSFTDITKLRWATLTFTHRLATNEDGTVFTHRAELTGPLTFLYRRTLGRALKRDLPITMNNLRLRAEAT